jgi:type II secretory pathway pseudopilin PulG
MSPGAIIAISIVGLLVAVFVTLRIAVAKQRMAVETVRARLAAAGNVRQRAEGVRVEVIFRMARSIGRATRTATCARTDDGLYCLSDDGRWGGRVPFGSGSPDPGDHTLATAPCLVKGGTAVGDLPDWLLPLLASLPPEGVLLQFQGGITWFVAVPEAEAWFGALMTAVRALR